MESAAKKEASQRWVRGQSTQREYHVTEWCFFFPYSYLSMVRTYTLWMCLGDGGGGSSRKLSRSQIMKNLTVIKQFYAGKLIFSFICKECIGQR